MSLEIVFGPMFSGKTTELCRRLRRLNSVNMNVMVLNHKSDIRFSDQPILFTHDKKSSENCVSVLSLEPILNTPKYRNSSFIYINEAQFFKDLFTFCKIAVERDDKNVVVFGLDGDYLRKPFGDIIKLIPLADKVTKLSAICKDCGDGTPALFTKRIVNNRKKVLIGGENEYVSVCRKHYLI